MARLRRREANRHRFRKGRCRRRHPALLSIVILVLLPVWMWVFLLRWYYIVSLSYYRRGWGNFLIPMVGPRSLPSPRPLNPQKVDMAAALVCRTHSVGLWYLDVDNVGVSLV